MIVGRTVNYRRVKNPISLHRARVADPLRALIAQLFGNGEQGAMYIPQPRVLGQQVLWQDVEGTVPVMSDGDPVGLMLDQSGNGNHATQVTSAARMAYSGGYLVPDGVDDNIDIPIGSGFVGDFALILSTGPIFGSIDTKTDGGWAYTKTAGFIPDGDIHAIVVLDRALTAAEKQRIVSHFSEGIISRPSTVTNAFRDRTDLTALDTSRVDWTQVTDAASAFRGCSGLTTPPDVSGWTQVTDAASAFRGCSGLTTPPDVSGWTQVTDAAHAFRDCSGLTSAIDLTNWNPTILVSAASMMLRISAAGFDQAAYDAALIAWDTNYDLSTVNAISAHLDRKSVV